MTYLDPQSRWDNIQPMFTRSTIQTTLGKIAIKNFDNGEIGIWAALGHPIRDAIHEVVKGRAVYRAQNWYALPQHAEAILADLAKI